jgi:hypothetical protein
VPLPFGSVSQVVSWAVTVCAVAGVGLASMRWWYGDLDASGVAFVVIGTAAGASASVSFSRASVLTLRTAPQGEVFWRRRVHDRLEFHGYRAVEDGPGGCVRYRTRQPRWLRWRENEFVVASAGGGLQERLVVSGPVLVNKLLLKALSRTAG